MGGIQAKAGSVTEVHAVRGGQLILRVSTSQTSKQCTASKPKRQNSFRGLISLKGSIWEEVEKLEKKTIKVYHGHCYLLDQSIDIQEKIFLWLSPRDLALLCLTSKSLRSFVLQFIEHHISSQGLNEKMAQFFAVNGFLLLPKEIVLRDRVANNERPQLLMYSAMRQFLGPVRRISLAEEFTRQNGSEISDVVRERDVSLKRDVMIFKRTCPSLRFVHTFKNVPAGKYIVQMRMRIVGSSSQPPSISYSELRRLAADRKSTGRVRVCRISQACQYNSSSSTLSSMLSELDQTINPVNTCNDLNTYDSYNNNNCRISSSRNNNNNNNSCEMPYAGGGDDGSRPTTPPPSPLAHVEVEELISQSIDVFWWFKIVEHSDYRSALSHAEIIYDRDSDWFFLRLNSFVVNKESDIEFEFVDMVDEQTDLALTFWRHTMMWDFVELRQIVKAP